MQRKKQLESDGDDVILLFWHRRLECNRISIACRFNPLKSASNGHVPGWFSSMEGFRHELAEYSGTN
jgi:hypothetical protein